jgi:hypothetical protein
MRGALTTGAWCTRRLRSTSDSDSNSDSDGEGGGARAPRKLLPRKRVDTSSRAFTMFIKPLTTSSSSTTPSVPGSSSCAPAKAATHRRISPPAAPRSRLANLASELVVTYGPPSLNEMTSLLSRGLGIAEEAMSVAVGSTTSMVRRSGHRDFVLDTEMRTSAERAMKTSGGSDRGGRSGHEMKTGMDMKTSVDMKTSG